MKILNNKFYNIFKQNIITVVLIILLSGFIIATEPPSLITTSYSEYSKWSELSDVVNISKFDNLSILF